MAEAIVLPKQGNSVESCLIMAWKKQVGDSVQQGDLLVEVETDKAIVQIESPASGTLLTIFFEDGADVPVMTNIAVVGEVGEDVEPYRPQIPQKAKHPAPTTANTAPKQTRQTQAAIPQQTTAPANGQVFISPRARLLAERYGINIHNVQPTGPAGRIIERDIQAMIAASPKMTPAARAKAAQEQITTPAQGSGIGNRITLSDLQATPQAPPSPPQIEEIPVRGIRKTIASNMRDSLQNTAQVTLNAAADARALLDYRKKLKNSPESMNLQNISINDILLYVVSRVLQDFPHINATLQDDIITQYQNVHLGFAVDTPRGLLVPVLQNANRMSLQALAQQTTRLAQATLDGTISSEAMRGGTFTVSNLGALGIESFTPIINPPQMAILGVGTIGLKPVQVAESIEFIPHIGLSLTIDHQIVDGAPGARFLQALSQALANLEVWLAR